MRAIVIDDAKAIRMLLKQMLSEIGFEVLEAENGREAIKLLGQTGPLDLAMVDWNMPIMNGLELVQGVRSHPKFSNMKIIMVTTETDIQQVMKSIEAGANEYIMKPFTKEMILEKLQIVGFGV